MATTLQGKTPGGADATYKWLIHAGAAGPLPADAANAITIGLGDGTDLPLSIWQGGMKIAGNLALHTGAQTLTAGEQAQVRENVAAVGYVSADDYAALAASVATAGLSLEHKLWAEVDGRVHPYTLRASANNNPPLWVRPFDYDPVTNPKAWMLDEAYFTSLNLLGNLVAAGAYVEDLQATNEIVGRAITSTDGIFVFSSGLTSSSLISGATSLRFWTLPDRTGTLVTLNGDQTFTGNLTASGTLNISGVSTTGSKLRVGGLELQPYQSNNVFLTDNLYFVAGTGFVRRATGYGAGLRFRDGNVMAMTANTGSAGTTATMSFPFKLNTGGRFGIGGNMSDAAGDFAGAQLYSDASGNITAAFNFTVNGQLTLPNQAFASESGALTKALGRRLKPFVDTRSTRQVVETFAAGTLVSGEIGEWGWSFAAEGTGSVSYQTSGFLLNGRRLRLTTGTVANERVYIASRATSASGADTAAAVTYFFNFPSGMSWADMRLRLGISGTTVPYSGGAEFGLVEYDSAVSANWRYVFDPSSGGSGVLDTVIGAVNTADMNNRNHAITIIGSQYNEKVLGGQAGHCRIVITVMNTGGGVAAAYSAEIDLSAAGALFNPRFYVELMTRTAAAKSVEVSMVSLDFATFHALFLGVAPF